MVAIGETKVEAAVRPDGFVLALCFADHMQFGEFAKKYIHLGCKIITMTIDDAMFLVNSQGEFE